MCFPFGSSGRRDYARSLVLNIPVTDEGSRQQAESLLDKRVERVERLHIRPLVPGDRAGFVESWGRVQARFIDGPGRGSPGRRPTVGRCDVAACS